MLDACLKYRFIIILKAKQICMTWTLGGGYSLWKALFHQGANVLILSKGETEAAEELDYARFIHSQLPPFLQIPIEKNQASMLTFPSMYSKIRALPSTESTGVGLGGASLVIMDEFEYHPYAKENYAEIKSAISSGGQLIIPSTADKEKIDTKFKELYNATKEGKTEFVRYFFPYDVMPYRDEQWYAAQYKDLASWQVECRFPRTENEALGVINVLKYFDSETIDKMEIDCRDPIETRYDGIVKIWKPPVPGRFYFAGADISDGAFTCSAMPVLDWHTNETVCTCHAKIKADKFATIMDEIGREYNNALLGPERNQPGYAVVEVLKNLQYPNLFYMKEDKPGWWTSSGNLPTSRGAILAELSMAIRQRQITIYDKEILKELRNFLQKPDEEPRAAKGAFDDFVMALAITWQLRKHIVGRTKFMVTQRNQLLG